MNSPNFLPELSALSLMEVFDIRQTRVLDEVKIERLYLDQAGLIYNWIFFCVGVSMLLMFWYLLFFILHHHPLLIVRCPKMFIFDLSLNIFNCIIQSMMNMNYFQLYLGCQPWTAFVDGTDVAANMVSIARALLYYNQAVHITKMVHHPVDDMLMDFLAFFTCPEDYFRNKDWKRVVREAVELQKVYVPRDAYDKRTCLGSWQHFFTRTGGFSRCILCISLWFCVGCAYSLLSTGLGMRSFVGNPSSSSPLSCWAVYLTPISPIVYFISCVLHLFVMINVFEMRDTVGIRNDMVVSLSIAVLCKIVNGLFMIWPVWKIGWQYTYPPTALFPPLTSMFYLMYFVFSSHTTVYVGILSKDATWWEKMRSTYTSYDNTLTTSSTTNRNLSQNYSHNAQSERALQSSEDDNSNALNAPFPLMNRNINSGVANSANNIATTSIDASSIKANALQLSNKKYSLLMLSSFYFPHSFYSSYIVSEEKNDMMNNTNGGLDSTRSVLPIRQKGQRNRPITTSSFLDDNDMRHFELRRAMMYLKGAKQYKRMIKMTHMERVWNTIRGKQSILALASTYYIFESLRFLGECDVLLDSIVVPRGEYRRIYEMFVRVDAPWQLNLSSMMRDQYLHLLQKYGLTVLGAEKGGEVVVYEKEEDQQVMTTCNSSNSNNNQTTGRIPTKYFNRFSKSSGDTKINSGSKISQALFNCGRAFTCRSPSNSEDHIEELTALLFKIRHDIFQMIDPMIRKDLLKIYPIASATSSPSLDYNSTPSSTLVSLNARFCGCLFFWYGASHKPTRASVLPIVTNEPSEQQVPTSPPSVPMIVHAVQNRSGDSVIDIENGGSAKRSDDSIFHSYNQNNGSNKNLYHSTITTTNSTSYDAYNSRKSDEDALSSFSSHNNFHGTRGSDNNVFCDVDTHLLAVSESAISI